MDKLNILQYRAKAKCIHNWEGYNRQSNIKEDDLVKGFYYKDVIDNEDSDSFTHCDYIRIEYGDHYSDIEIDPSTLQISFDNGESWRSIKEVVSALHLQDSSGCYEED